MTKDVIMLTKEQKDLFIYIDSIMPDDGHLVHDLRDPKQYSFAELMNELGGFDKEKYPGFNELLNNIRSYQNQNGYQLPHKTKATSFGFQTKAGIDDLGLTPEPDPKLRRACGDGYLTVLGGFRSANLMFVIRDKDNNIIAYKSKAGFEDVYLDVLDVISREVGVTPPIKATMFYSYEARSEKDVFGNIMQCTGTVELTYNGETVSDPVLEHPKRRAKKPYNPKAINIGLGRPWDQEGMDYCWNEPIKEKPNGKIPFVGSVTFKHPILPLEPNKNFILDIYVTDREGGGGTCQLAPVDMAKVYQCFKIDPKDPNTLTWNLPPGTSDANPGNPIVFSEIKWPSDMLSYFACEIVVTLQNGELGFALIKSSPLQDRNPIDGTLYIMPIEFIWHCIGEGTKVILANGTDFKTIEEFKAGDSVITNNNGMVETVSSTFKGAHYGEVRRISTDKGHTLIITHNHVVITPGGGKYTHELKLGDEVIVHGGTAKIISNEELKDYQGHFYNLCIGEYLDELENPVKSGAFFANGILVGDIKAQRTLRHQCSHDKDWLKARAGDFWAKDIESYFSDKRFREYK